MPNAVPPPKDPFSLLDTCKFLFKTPEDIETLLYFLSETLFHEKPSACAGTRELMLNAVEHGNLAIGFELKSKLMASKALAQEIDARLKNPHYRDRVGELVLTRRPNGVYVIVQDQGDGFDPSPYLTLSPARSASPQGRGIAAAATIGFDELKYNPKGNQAVGFVSGSKTLNW